MLSKLEVSSQTLSLPRHQPEIGYLIRDLRQLIGLTQEQFAGMLGVSFSTLNRWENGRMKPSPLALKQIEGALNQLSQSPEPTLQDSGKMLLAKYRVCSE